MRIDGHRSRQGERAGKAQLRRPSKGFTSAASNCPLVFMHAQLMDLRYLHLAKGIEEMFEGLEKAFDRHLPPGAVREALRPIFVDGPFHRRLQEAYTALNAGMAAESPQIKAADLLECILACEKSAQKFYEDHAKELSDPALKAIFKGMGNEEGSHVRCVQQALALQGQLDA